MTVPLLAVVSLVGFVCAVAVTCVCAARTSRDCAEWLQERQEREQALQHAEAERVAGDEGLAVVAELNHAYYELPSYEHERSSR
jgi:hypothetical protein